MAAITEVTGRKAKTTTASEVFLKACVKFAKEKPSIDYDGLAQETGMSVGGAANKVRAFLKELEDAGAAWVKKDGKEATVGTKDVVAAGTKRKRAAKKNAKEDAGDDDAAAAKFGEDDTASETESAKKKQARGGATIKDKIFMNKDKGKEVIVGTSGQQLVKKKAAHGKAPAKAMQSASTIDSEDEDEKLSDAAGKKELKPAKKRAARKVKTKTKTKTTISAPTSDDEDEDVGSATDSAAEEELTKRKPTVVKPFTRKELPAIKLVDVKTKFVKTETVPARKPEPVESDGDELDSADKE